MPLKEDHIELSIPFSYVPGGDGSATVAKRGGAVKALLFTYQVPGREQPPFAHVVDESRRRMKGWVFSESRNIVRIVHASVFSSVSEYNPDKI